MMRLHPRVLCVGFCTGCWCRWRAWLFARDARRTLRSSCCVTSSQCCTASTTDQPSLKGSAGLPRIRREVRAAGPAPQRLRIQQRRQEVQDVERPLPHTATPKRRVQRDLLPDPHDGHGAGRLPQPHRRRSEQMVRPTPAAPKSEAPAHLGTSRIASRNPQRSGTSAACHSHQAAATPNPRQDAPQTPSKRRPASLKSAKMRSSAQFAQQTAHGPPSWGVRELENAKVRALGRVGSGMDLARIWNGLLQLCDDLSAFAEVRALLPSPVLLSGTNTVSP